MPTTLRSSSRHVSPVACVSPPPEHASAGKRWRFRRNLVIYVAHRQGLSQRLLAEVFDLPRSRIAEILDELRRNEGGGGGDPEPDRRTRPTS